MNILVTGCYGQLGREFQKLAACGIECQWCFTDADTLDITNPDAVERCFSEQLVGVCINCAAYTAVDQAEDEPSWKWTEKTAKSTPTPPNSSPPKPTEPLTVFWI